MTQSTSVWIISTVNSECAECGAACKRGDHVLWLPGQPRGKNNLCRSCGEKLNRYPAEPYWQRREQKLEEASRVVHG